MCVQLRFLPCISQALRLLTVYGGWESSSLVDSADCCLYSILSNDVLSKHVWLRMKQCIVCYLVVKT